VPADQRLVSRQFERERLDAKLVRKRARDTFPQHRGMVAIAQLVHDLPEAGDRDLRQALPP
jgi:hypothetical protein